SLGLLILMTRIVPVSAEPYEVRTWTSLEGASLEASFVRLSGASVVLLLPNGKQSMIRMSALGTEDQEYLASLQAAEEQQTEQRRAEMLANSKRGPQARSVSRRGEAADGFLSAVEKEVIAEMNLARTDPRKYVQFVRDYRATHDEGFVFKTPEGLFSSKEGLKAVDEAIAFMEKVKPVGKLQASKGLSEAAMAHVKDTGPVGKVGHEGTDKSAPADRMSRQGKWEDTCGENISYGKSTGRDIVVQLIIDDGVADRGHRTNLFRDEFNVAGVAIGPHKIYRICCVIDYAGGFSR
ncbi:MAG: hypothetical protein O3C57_07820, partial [Verrucomicrobia bacterium]|nr:hypothetical protein [Verrucomicrobiota bacterium]